MIAVVIPTLNEAAHIEGLLRQLLAEATPDLLELWVTDGGSDDGTRAIVDAVAREDRRVRLLPNHARIQAAGVNLAAAAADPRATALVRLDAHAGYPAGYVADLVAALEATGADSVVVRLRTRGESGFQKAVAAVSNSKLGTGGAAHRVGGASRWIDHGHHAAFRRDRFLALGGYDTRFRANEDAEFDVRLRRAGGRIWFAADIEVDYHPRRTPLRLARQYYGYGRGRAQNWLKNGERLRPRQAIPPALVILIAAAIVLAPWAPWVLLAPVGYFAGALAVGVAFAVRGRDPHLLGVAVALPAMHLAWGAGFLIALGWRKFPASKPTRGDDAAKTSLVAGGRDA